VDLAPRLTSGIGQVEHLHGTNHGSGLGDTWRPAERSRDICGTWKAEISTFTEGLEFDMFSLVS
jgi:hypothetical protein